MFKTLYLLYYSPISVFVNLIRKLYYVTSTVQRHNSLNPFLHALTISFLDLSSYGNIIIKLKKKIHAYIKKKSLHYQSEMN